ncbi:MAG: hypothetical protein JNL09_01780 [Anaerolineales bacterium]|nr:hypothetical protein [Anaerolineales bacterium]
MRHNPNETALRRAAECWGDPARREHYFELYTANSIWHHLPPELPPTLEGARQFYARVWAAAPKAILVLDEVFPHGSYLGCRYTVFNQPTRLDAGRAGLTVLRFEAGRCVERWLRLGEAAFDELLR